MGNAYDDVGWGQRIIPFRDFLARAGYAVTPEQGGAGGGKETIPDKQPFYLAQHPLFSQFPELERDISLPDYVWSGPSATDDVPGYQTPKDGDGLAINVWIGSAGGEIVSPAHTVRGFRVYSEDNE